ncbi:MAG: hypothetical protein ACR2P2_16230, partial [Nakamurella sp.]
MVGVTVPVALAVAAVQEGGVVEVGDHLLVKAHQHRGVEVFVADGEVHDAGALGHRRRHRVAVDAVGGQRDAWVGRHRHVGR